MLLVCLLVKGFKSGNLKQYGIIYFILASMSYYWSCQILTAVLYHPDSLNNNKSEALFYMINLQPISTVLFGLKYFMTVERFLGFKVKWRQPIKVLIICTTKTNGSVQLNRLLSSILAAFLGLLLGSIAFFFLVITIVKVRQLCDSLPAEKKNQN